MATGFRRALIVIAAAVAVGGAVWTQVPATSPATEAYKAPRTAEGTPDLSGIWQAVNTANYDIQAHAARPALAVVPGPPRTAAPGLARSTRSDLPAPEVRAL